MSEQIAFEAKPFEYEYGGSKRDAMYEFDGEVVSVRLFVGAPKNWIGPVSAVPIGDNVDLTAKTLLDEIAEANF